MAIRTIKLRRTNLAWDSSDLEGKTLQFGEPLYNANSNDLVIGSTDGQLVGAVNKVFHAVPKTLKGKALYLDGSALKNEDETTVTIDAASSISGVLNVANGGTGQTSAVNAANAFMNALSTGTSTPTDTDYYISQYAGGGTSTTTYHRRPHSALWTYIKGKANAVYAAMSHTHSAGEITSGTLAVARGGTNASNKTDANNNLGAWSLSVGTAIPANADLNNYSTEGNYTCTAISTAKTLLNTPYGNASPNTPAFIMKVIYTSGTNIGYIRQEIFEFLSFNHWVRIGDVAEGYWRPWSLYTYKSGTAAVGSANQPAYVEASGNIAAVSTVNVAYGGTGRNTLTTNAVLSGNGTGQVKMTATAKGAAYATSANGALTFGTLPIAQGGTGVTSLAALKTSLGIDSIGVWYAGTSAPSNTNLLWIDTNATTGGLKYYKNSTDKWVHVPVAFV